MSNTARPVGYVIIVIGAVNSASVLGPTVGSLVGSGFGPEKFHRVVRGLARDARVDVVERSTGGSRLHPILVEVDTAKEPDESFGAIYQQHLLVMTAIDIAVLLIQDAKHLGVLRARWSGDFEAMQVLPGLHDGRTIRSRFGEVIVEEHPKCDSESEPILQYVEQRASGRRRAASRLREGEIEMKRPAEQDDEVVRRGRGLDRLDHRLVGRLAIHQVLDVVLLAQEVRRSVVGEPVIGVVGPVPRNDIG